jgi:hypothetical protein
MKDDSELVSLLKRANEAVAAANVPEDLRSVAFAKAFDQVSGGGEQTRREGAVPRREEVTSGLGTIKSFLEEKKPKDDVTRVTTLAYFQTHAKQQTSYKTADLRQARIEAALSSFNVSRAISHAQRSGYMTTAGRKGTYQITSVGEAIVEALPNQDAVKKTKALAPRRRRKPARAKEHTVKRS